MRPTEPFRQEHQALIEHVEHLRAAAAKVPELELPERAALIDRILGFLLGTLVPHAEAEEQVLYPEWARLLDHADAAAPMIHDHRAIVERIDRLKVTPTSDVAQLQELLYGLYALISVHFRKEEDLQLPVFDAEPADYVEQVMRRMEAASGHAHAHAH